MNNDPGAFTVHRGQSPADHFLIVANDFARGNLPVPLKALDRVLLLHLLSLPPGWQGARQQLDESVLEGRDAVKRALARLEVAGYLLRTKTRTPAGSWVWRYAVTVDPVEHPLVTAPSPENQAMAATTGNTGKPQVSPSTENPSLENQAILEDGPKKTEFQKTESNSVEGADAIARASLRASNQPLPKPSVKRGRLEGRHLVGKPVPTITRRLTALWSAEVVEHGGELPADAEFSGNGAPVSRPQHPAGHQLKAILGQYDTDDLDAACLDDMIGQVRNHAARTAELQREAAAA